MDFVYLPANPRFNLALTFSWVQFENGLLSCQSSACFHLLSIYPPSPHPQQIGRCKRQHKYKSVKAIEESAVSW